MTSPIASSLIALLRGQAPPDVDASRLATAAIEQGVAGHVRDVGRGELSAILAPQVAVQEACTRAQMAAAREIAAAFDQARVPCVFVKGVAMALTVYDSLALRPFGDIDIIVHADRLADSKRVLASCGFKDEPADPPNPMELDFVRKEPETGVELWIDLHWDFTARDGLQAAVRVPIAELLTRSKRVEGVPVPRCEDSLLLAAANVVRNGVDRLILVMDFARLSGRVDWSVVLKRAAEWRLKSSLWVGLSLAVEHFGARVPKHVMDEIEPPSWRRAWLRKLLAREEVWRPGHEMQPRYRYIFKLLCLDGWRDVVTTGVAIPKALARKLRLRQAPR